MRSSTAHKTDSPSTTPSRSAEPCPFRDEDLHWGKGRLLWIVEAGGVNDTPEGADGDDSPSNHGQGRYHVDKGFEDDAAEEDEGEAKFGVGVVAAGTEVGLEEELETTEATSKEDCP